MKAQLEILSEELTQDSYESLPKSKSLPIVGLGLALQKQGVSLLTDLSRKHGDFVKFPMPGMRGVLVSDPEFIRLVFLQSERLFSKGTIYDRMKTFVGDGLVTSSAQLWRRQRRLANPAFNQNALASYQDIIARKAEALTNKLMAHRGHINIHKIMTDVTMDIAIEALLSSDGVRFKGELSQIFELGQDYLGYLFWAAFPPPLWIPTKRNRRFNKARNSLKAIMDSIIAERRSKGVQGDDYLGRLMKSQDQESGQGMSQQLIRDELTTFMIAGHDTTANTLAFTFYLLAKHPEYQQLIFEEISQVNPDILFDQDLEEKLPLTRRVLFESMRLYPTAWMVNRTLMQDIKWGDYTFKKGTMFFLPQYAVHRHPNYWDHPDTFYPDHFLAEKAADRPEFAFFPFGGGTRKCIGFRLAIQEAMILLVSVIRHFQFDGIAANDDLKLSPNVTMAPRDGVVVRLQHRPEERLVEPLSKEAHESPLHI